MAILLLLDPAQYFQGSVRVYRGDAWAIDGQIVNQVGGVKLPVDLTGASATAYFPPATGTELVAASVELTVAKSGAIRIPVSEDISPTIAETPNGLQAYVVVDGIPATGNLFTAQMPDPDLAILDREFQQFV